MLKLYAILASGVFLSSCGLRVNYMGTTAAPTDKVDVFVEASNIKKPYTVMGKGYVQPRALSSASEEKIQAKAITKAREKGADAILFEDFYLVNNDNSITTTVDTVRTRITKSSSGPVVASGRNILFLKYQ